MHAVKVKNAAETARCIFLVCSNEAIAERTGQKWFAKTENGIRHLKDATPLPSESFIRRKMARK